jgi:hypothetical protein
MEIPARAKPAEIDLKDDEGMVSKDLEEFNN